MFLLVYWYRSFSFWGRCMQDWELGAICLVLIYHIGVAFSICIYQHQFWKELVLCFLGGLLFFVVVFFVAFEFGFDVPFFIGAAFVFHFSLFASAGFVCLTQNFDENKIFRLKTILLGLLLEHISANFPKLSMIL